MNARNNSLIKTAFASSILFAAAVPALAQVTYDRTLEASEISISPAGGTGLPGQGYDIAARIYVINKGSLGVDLSHQVIVTVNDIPQFAAYRIIWLGPQNTLCTTGGSSCAGSSCWISSSCRRAFDGDCACFDYYDFVAPSSLPLVSGDVVGVQIVAAAGAVPEQLSDNDAAAVTFRPPCPPDVNGSGELSVQDIFDFLAAYFAGTAAADFNQSGAATVQDIFDFLAAYFAGCA